MRPDRRKFIRQTLSAALGGAAEGQLRTNRLEHAAAAIETVKCAGCIGHYGVETVVAAV